jgi:ribosomal protein L11 methyltransferase
LDIGTGSGILAIAAVKLGYAPVEAFDVDPAAVRVAGANARSNGVRERLRLARRDLACWRPQQRQQRQRRRYDVVCANLTADLLLSEREQLLSGLKSGGRLVLAGILRSQFQDVARAYKGAGLKLERRVKEGEWVSGAFTDTSLE